MKGRILLTGGGGMVGRNILEHPEAIHWHITAPSRMELDLTRYEQVCTYIQQNQPDLILHTAGLVGGIQANNNAPVAFLVTNLDIGRNIAMAAKTNGTPRLLNLGSSCMYPREAPNPLREEMLLQGELEPTNEGYALAKIMTAKLCSYIRRENPALDYKTLIPCNLFGRFDKFEAHHAHLIAAIISKVHQACLAQQDSVEIWGDGLARREFMYAGDFADAVWHAVEHFDTLPEMMNIGLGHDFTINEYYQTVTRVIGWQGRFVHDLSKPVGMKQKLVSIDRQAACGWQARTSLEQGIALAYDYFLKEIAR